MNQYGYGQPQSMYNPQVQNSYGFNTPYVSGINWAQGIEGPGNVTNVSTRVVKS